MKPLALVTSLMLVGCTSAIPKKSAGDDEPLPPQVALEGVRIRSWEGDQVVATGRAARLTYDRSSSNFEASEVLVRFPSERRKGSDLSDLEVRAPVATGNLSSRQADGAGGVLLRSSSGLRARTDRAHFDGEGMVASGNVPIDVTGQGFDVTADGFRYEFASEKLSFEGNVQSRLGGADR